MVELDVDQSGVKVCGLCGRSSISSDVPFLACPSFIHLDDCFAPTFKTTISSDGMIGSAAGPYERQLKSTALCIPSCKRLSDYKEEIVPCMLYYPECLGLHTSLKIGLLSIFDMNQ